ncbi:tRNA pseudouridine(38-40) synthase TruA [Ornithinibacillus halotolerans]|uniref:tRNA pseudouridine synthase A n=1 Tax=Ornithinibacillus halotolerans TaxID=1274357 RepID=A0A916S7H5_9BACI|nr:tRNA pseudouridine(38-40) synthase TruA [Ornithinibacillus halotolerans]GGA88040.1 tRNA pseudouridine synthase A 1 [Ornithinibacillus halotolerans]
MPKVKCTIAYDGSHFFGYQIQPDKRTVQGELESALQKIHKKNSIRVHASGRTDTGVHAKGQTIHFESDLKLSSESWTRALNALLPDDLYVHQSEIVPDQFHARFDVVEKEYRYFVLNREERDIFRRKYIYHYPYSLDIEKIERACKYLIGTHDFTTFSSARATVKGDKIRTLFEVSCRSHGEELEFVFRGSGFLYNMVRILVGTLLSVGQGKIEPNDIITLLEAKDRSIAGKTAPAEGLYLWRVGY